VVVPGARAVGTDVEQADLSARVAAFVLTRRERQELLAPVGRYDVRALFAAKEAAYKALNGTGSLGDFVFWRIELGRSGGVLTASYRGDQVPVWVRCRPGLAFAVAVRT
jgi:4'-phosphopantetheinyl transferase EntD